MTTAAIGNDGVFLNDACVVLNYAYNIMDEHGAPTVIVPVIVDGEPLLFVTGYRPLDKEAERAFAAAWSEDFREREAAAIGFCISGYRDAPGQAVYKGLLGGEL